jgi:hypothetical protein
MNNRIISHRYYFHNIHFLYYRMLSADLFVQDFGLVLADDVDPFARLNVGHVLRVQRQVDGQKTRVGAYCTVFALVQ